MFLRKYLSKKSESSEVSDIESSSCTESTTKEIVSGNKVSKKDSKVFLKLKSKSDTSGPSSRKIRKNKKSKPKKNTSKQSENASESENDIASNLTPCTKQDTQEDKDEPLQTTVTLVRRKMTEDEKVDNGSEPKLQRKVEVVYVKNVQFILKDESTGTQLEETESKTESLKNKNQSSESGTVKGAITQISNVGDYSSEKGTIDEKSPLTSNVGDNRSENRTVNRRISSNSNFGDQSNAHSLEDKTTEKSYENITELSNWGQILMLKVAYDKIPVDYIKKPSVEFLSHRDEVMKGFELTPRTSSQKIEAYSESTCSKLSHRANEETLSAQRLSHLSEIVEACVFLTDLMQEIGNTAPLVATALKLAAQEYPTVSDEAYPLAVLAYKHAAFSMSVMKYTVYFVRLITDSPFSNIVFERTIEPMWKAISNVLSGSRILAEKFLKIQQDILQTLPIPASDKSVEGFDKSYVLFHLESTRSMIKTTMLNLATANRELSKAFHSFQTQSEYERYIEDMKCNVGDIYCKDQYLSQKKSKPNRDRRSINKMFLRFFKSNSEMARCSTGSELIPVL
ncbi:hypothetical protein C0J52_08496 [Blattella germanica]|nr:hypothetical protein C0J52_08496 [Blattella germanica]PSN42374.1 hypothetical protein C0J52_08496 [Blattella germanica]